MWYARIQDGSDYGKWVPTGCIDKQEAIDYIVIHYREPYSDGRLPKVKEWLKL